MLKHANGSRFRGETVQELVVVRVVREREHFQNRAVKVRLFRIQEDLSGESLSILCENDRHQRRLAGEGRGSGAMVGPSEDGHGCPYLERGVTFVGDSSLQKKNGLVKVGNREGPSKVPLHHVRCDLRPSRRQVRTFSHLPLPFRSHPLPSVRRGDSHPRCDTSLFCPPLRLGRKVFLFFPPSPRLRARVRGEHLASPFHRHVHRPILVLMRGPYCQRIPK